jgi:uncharacterized protein
VPGFESRRGYEIVASGWLLVASKKEVLGEDMTENREIQQTIVKILQKLVAEYQPIKVILFGSYAYGSPTRDSDIDLLIIKESSDRFLDRCVQVQSILTGLHRSLPVEPIVLTPGELEKRLSMGDQFIQEILTRGEVLYAA